MGYLVTKDVRFYNEFLWFYKEEDGQEELKKECDDQFVKNLDDQQHHYFPKATITEARDYLKKYNLPQEPAFDASRKIGLIGFPPFFPKIIEGLSNSGFVTDQVFIPYHPNKHINRLLSNPLFVKFISRLKGNRYKYNTIKLRYDDNAIKEILDKRSFDVGFHKLNCIIRENIFGSFRKGLINDHWGLLPFLRGKSTIAYSVLFGFPMVATMHLIEKGIDTGKIVGYSEEIDINGMNSLEAIRNQLRKTLPGRVIRAVKQLTAIGFEPAVNETARGLTFYEIHPWLYSFINKKLNKSSAQQKLGRQ
jgi:folate-dependent phosphoribosylglycinamide formyltransferase PurN